MSSKHNHTPSSRSAGSGSHASPFNALPNSALQHHATQSASAVFSSRLIPRDYLTSRTKSPTKGTTSTHPTSATTQTEQEEQYMTKNGNTSIDGSQTPQPRRLKSDSVSDKENVDRRQELELERTRSLESVATATSGTSSIASSRPTVATSIKSVQDNMPRTSSLDSAISSLSSSSVHRKDAGDISEPTAAEVRHLINGTDSIETLVLRLLKEKNAAANQNNQLWKLVEKQRTLLLGLNKDLERISKERDKYRRRVKELQLQGALPKTATQSPAREPLAPVHANAVKPPTLSSYNNQSDFVASSPVEASRPATAKPEGPSNATNSASENEAAVRHPALQAQPTSLSPQQPTFALNEGTPPSEKSVKGFSARKSAPKPLNLLQKNNSDASLVNTSDRGLLNEEDEEPRGRRKTREEDDQDREKSLKQEQEARSKSKKTSNPPPKSEDQIPEIVENNSAPVPVPAAISRIQGSIPGLNVPQPSSLHEKLISMPLRSPGLPASPRPMINNFLSAQPSAGLPMSPRAPPPGPLSPRAPKQPIPPPMMSPSPFTDPAIVQRQNAVARQAAQNSYQQSDRLQVHDPSVSNEVPTVYQGLVSSQYPNLLLPPNALPSIQVQVASSRLRPSRYSMLGLRTQDDSTVFSLSVYSRASRNELWRIEKIPAVLPQLEQQLRPRCRELPKMPDRKLFVGYSPVVVDARREAIDLYFEELLDMELDEPSALIICRFLSTDVLDPANDPPRHPGVNQESLPQATSSSGKVVKTGFLTKRGKNFGGWKSRYFILDGPELKYYDTPGGPQIGAIKIAHAKIGSQRTDDSGIQDSEDHYRHAFLIQEPKKKDSTLYVRHILCAESDQDRDQWVNALLHYVELDSQKESESPTASSFSGTTRVSNAKDKVLETHSNTSSPTSPASLTDISISDTASRNTTNISGPMNGAPISDAAQWGNKSAAAQPREKSSKIDKIFHFKKPSEEQLSVRSSDQSAKPRVLRHNGYVRAVFGLPLAEAVEFCAPFNDEDAKLPAVVYRCIEYLRFRKASNEEGLFRLSGSNLVIKTLKERFNQEGDIDLCRDDELYDVHAVASLFKTYFRELPSPLLTRDLHIEFLKVLELESQEQKLASYNMLVHRLPLVNFELLRALSEYLLEVTQNSGKNKMSVRNMGIVFSPTVNIPTPVFNLFLSEYHTIFEKTLEEAQVQQSPIQRTDLQVPADLSPVDIRSPRHQMFSDIPTPAYNQTAFNTNTRVDNTSSHTISGSGEFGFTPIHPSYEHGNYSTKPHEPQIQAFIPPSPQDQQNNQLEGEEQFSSLNRILMPQGGGSEKRRKRESMMLL